jgi:hypothetical protein
MHRLLSNIECHLETLRTRGTDPSSNEGHYWKSQEAKKQKVNLKAAISDETNRTFDQPRTVGKELNKEHAALHGTTERSGRVNESIEWLIRFTAY